MNCLKILKDNFIFGMRNALSLLGEFFWGILIIQLAGDFCDEDSKGIFIGIFGDELRIFLKLS